MSQPNIWGSTFEIGSTYGSRQFIDANTTVLRDGWIAVTWRDMATQVIKCQILNADGSGSGPVLDVSDAGETALGPNIAARSNGRFTIAYDVKNPSSGYTLKSKTFDVFQGSVEGASVIHEEDENASHSVAVTPFEDSLIYTFNDAKYNLSKTWLYNRVYETRFTSNRSTAEVYDNDDTGSLGKSIVLATQDTTYVSLYQSFKDGLRTFYFDIRNPDGNRVALKTLSGVSADSNGFNNGSYIDIAALDNGNFVVVWVENSGATGILKARVYSPFGFLYSEQTIYAGNHPLTQPAVEKLAGGGYVFAVAEDGTGTIRLGNFTGSGLEYFSRP
jgi:hypothetical protein